ncbi:Sjoegren syndrome nuclear autoantigen [Paragonimus kellicotti]|nr:Sjoegren syndrome nuclear autoantigen [Paragonimus kellicotti]
MAHQGAALQNYNNELVKCFEELCKRREDLQRQIQQDETERSKLQREINSLNEKLTTVNEALQKKLATRSEYDRTIAESEAAYMKILESSQTLLTVLKREGQNIVQRATTKNVSF